MIVALLWVGMIHHLQIKSAAESTLIIGAQSTRHQIFAIVGLEPICQEINTDLKVGFYQT